MSESNIPSAAVKDAFQSAAITAYQELAKIEACAEQCSTTEANPSAQMVLAAIRLLRPVPGTMTLVLTVETAVQLAARYLPNGTPLSAEMIDDVAGEFANVIAGQAKTILKGTLHHFRLSTPSVTRSTGFVVPADETAVLLSSPIGKILLLVDLPACALSGPIWS